MGKDLYDLGNKEDKDFARNTLKILWRTDRAADNCTVNGVYSPAVDMSSIEHAEINNKTNSKIYLIESPDALEPVDRQGHTIMRYAENSMSAAVAVGGAYRVAVFGFPLETITDKKKKADIFKGILSFLK